MPRIVAVTFAFVVPAAVGAQVLDTAKVPKELLQASLSMYQSRAPEINVGVIKNAELKALVPAGAVIVGEIEYAASRMGPGERSVATVVLSYTPDSTRALFTSHATQAGWTVAPSMQARAGGGIASVSMGFMMPAMFCRDTLMASISIAGRTRGGSYATITTGAQRNTPCDPRMARDYMAMGRSREDQIVLPQLQPPADAIGGSSGESSSNGVRELTARFDTKLTAKELTAHFAAQFVSDKWIANKAAGDADVAQQTFTRTDAKGQRVIASLIIARVEGQWLRLSLTAEVK